MSSGSSSNSAIAISPYENRSTSTVAGRSTSTVAGSPLDYSSLQKMTIYPSSNSAIASSPYMSSGADSSSAMASSPYMSSGSSSTSTVAGSPLDYSSIYPSSSSAIASSPSLATLLASSSIDTTSSSGSSSIPGSYGEEKRDPDVLSKFSTPEVAAKVGQLLNKSVISVRPISYSSQVVAGTNYRVKAIVRIASASGASASGASAMQGGDFSERSRHGRRFGRENGKGFGGDGLFVMIQAFQPLDYTGMPLQISNVYIMDRPKMDKRDDDLEDKIIQIMETQTDILDRIASSIAPMKNQRAVNNSANNANQQENTEEENTGEENAGEENAGEENTGEENTGEEEQEGGGRRKARKTRKKVKSPRRFTKKQGNRKRKQRRSRRA